MLFETSYKLNQLPADWYITAIFKKGNKSDPSNYRPISLTSVICKIMESIIKDQIMDFFPIIIISVITSSGLLKVDLLHYSYFALWMKGPHCWIREHK